METTPSSCPRQLHDPVGREQLLRRTEQLRRAVLDHVANLDDATAITVDAGTPSVSGKDFALETGGTISGTVTDQDTNAIIPYINVSVDFNNSGYRCLHQLERDL